MVAKAGTWRGVKWKLAPALIQLMKQVDAEWPDRDKRSDGSIASARHYQNNPHSDHDPEQVKVGGKVRQLVTAVDITHNEKKGANCHLLFERLRQSMDDRIKYVIFNHQIFNSPSFHSAGARARGPWTAGKYTGYDGHTGHLHISIEPALAASNAVRWQIENPQRHPPPVTAGMVLPGTQPKAPVSPSFSQEQEAALLGIGADPNSVAYTLRFYRAVAQRAGIDGSKPEEVAAWLLDNIQEANLKVANHQHKV